MLPEQSSDPFGERIPLLRCKAVHVLGARFRFESNDPALLQLVAAAYQGLPRHRLSARTPEVRVSLLASPVHSTAPARTPRRLAGREQPLPLDLLQASGFLGGVTPTSHSVILSPSQRTGLVVVPRQMLRFPYHVRYELIEFAVFTLAARVQHLVPLHAACVGIGGRGLLLMGPSGAGKSTVALQCLLQGFDFLAEDSVFVAPHSLLATGVANFLHVRADSVAWLGRSREASLIRRSPTIVRRSGVRKFEVDLRQNPFRSARAPLKITGVVFLSPRRAGSQPLLRSLSRPEARTAMTREQGYAAIQPQWQAFSNKLAGLNTFELRRGDHPREAAEVLAALL